MFDKSSSVTFALPHCDEPVLLKKSQSFSKAQILGIAGAVALWLKRASVSPQSKKVPDHLREDLGLPPRVKEIQVTHRYWQL